MYSRTQILEIISGKRNGFFPALVRAGLGCLTPIYRCVIFFRNRKYDSSIKNANSKIVSRVDIPVISVGNLTTGGTGKTPHVIWIAKYLRRRDLRVALISRGYGSESGRNDEALELEIRLPDVPHLQDPDRFSMAQIAVEELESEIILLDDAFQHRKLARDLDIVLIDATLPFGYGRLLPRGLLREPLSSLRRSDVVIITRANLVNDQSLDEIESRIRPYIGDRPIARTKTTMSSLLQFDGKRSELQILDGQSVFQFCAIGNPDAFHQTISSIGAKVVGSKVFDDHHNFTRDDLQEVGQLAQSNGAQAIVCTHKDLVKIGTNQIGGIPVFAVTIEIEFLTGEEELSSLLDKAITR